MPNLHLCIPCAILMLSTSAHAATSSTNLIWSSPSKGQTFGPGDPISANWMVEKALVSPSFRLCACQTAAAGMGKRHSNKDDEDEEEDEEVGSTSKEKSQEPDEVEQDNPQDVQDGVQQEEVDNVSSSSSTCGTVVWATVKDNGDGSYSASLTAPTTAEDSCFYLRMDDDFGSAQRSPHFVISPTGLSSENATDPAIDTPGTNSQQSPLGIPISSPNSTSPSPGSPPSRPSVSVIANVAPGSVTPNIQPGYPAPPAPPVLATRVPPPKAAFIVPLSMVGAILLCAGALSYRHNKRLQEERVKEAGKLKLSELEKGGSMLNQPVPLFMPAAHNSSMRDHTVWREERRCTRSPFAYSDTEGKYTHMYTRRPPPGADLYRSSSIRSHETRFSTRDRPSSRYSQYSDDRQSRSPPFRRPSIRSARGMYHREMEDDGETVVTEAILEEYMLPSPYPDSVRGSPKADAPLVAPPKCLIPAHLRSEVTHDNGEDDRMVEVDLFEAVARNLRTKS